MTLGSPKARDYTGRPTRPVGTHEPRAQWPRGQWAHRWWQTQTNLTRGRGRLHRACHRREGVKVQVQQTGLLREWPRGLKLGSSSRGGRQLVSRESTQHTHTAGAHAQGRVHLHTEQCHPRQTLAHVPTHTSLAPTSVIHSRPTICQTNAKPPLARSLVSALQATEAPVPFCSLHHKLSRPHHAPQKCR